MATRIDLPADLKQSFSESDYAAVLRWWESLTAEQQREYSDVSEMTPEDFATLSDIEDTAPDPETQPYYDYLINHELRLVGFVDDVAAQSSYRIMSSYVASLGSDYRHGKPGTVS